MEVAESDQILEFGFTAIRPMFDMVPVRVAFVAASGKATASVA